MPWINFFRYLSPIAWIPFAIMWFGVGDPPAIFILFLATFFQIVLATAAAAARYRRSTTGSARITIGCSATAMPAAMSAIAALP